MIIYNLTTKYQLRNMISHLCELADITYMPYGTSNRAYLSTIKDAFTNEILTYNLTKNLKLDIVIDTIEKLMKNNK